MKLFRSIKRINRAGWCLGMLGAILIFTLLGGISWIITCGIVKLITLCFGLTFSWLWATGIWLVMFLLRSIFSRSSS